MSTEIRKNLLKDIRFWPLFWTQFLGALNDNYFKNALVILITYKSISLLGLGPGALVAAAGGIFILPFFLCSASAGLIADRFEKSLVIRWAKITELIIMIFAALGFIYESYGLLFFVLFLMGAQSAFFGPLKYGALPSLLKKEELCTGNAYVSGGTFVAILVGTIVGGQSATGNNSLTIISVGIVLTSLIGIFFASRVQKMNEGDKDIQLDLTLFRPMKPILKLTKSDPHVFKTIMGISWFWFLGAGVLSLLPNYVKTVLGGQGEVATLFLAIFTIGMGIGSFICERISKNKAELGVVAISSFGMSLFLVAMFLVGMFWNKPVEMVGIIDFFKIPGAYMALVSLLFVSIFGGLFIIPQMTFIQTYSDPKRVASIIAGNNIWNAIFMVSASVMIMVFYKFNMAIPYMFLTLAVLNFIASFILYAIRSEVTLRLWGWIISNSLYKIKIEGQDNLPVKGPYILASNHVSFIDWLILWAVSPLPVRYVIDWNYYYAPMGPFWYRQAGLIPIATRRESVEVLEKAFEGISQNLKEGHVLGIFPEGYLCRNAKIKRLQPGLKKIISDNPVPVVPVMIQGLWGSIFSREGKGVLKKWPSPFRRKLIIKVGEPITPDTFEIRLLEKTFHDLNGGDTYDP